MSDPERPRSRPLEFVTKPWGSFSTLEEGSGYKIKRLVVQPGQRLSMQKHQRRAEHWVVVSGTATIVRGDRCFTLRTRECAVIPGRAWHRIENHGKQPVVVIEVQHGSYLGEDDIIRKQDDYGRIEPRALPAATCLRLPVASATQTGATTHRQATAAQAGASREPRRKGSRK
jgi:mannose-6-phosphate isomerase-like protein (cupin superfamily)